MPALPAIAAIATIASAAIVTGKTLLTKAPESPPLPEVPKGPAPVDTKKLTDDAMKRQSALDKQAQRRAGAAASRGGTMLTGQGGAIGAAPTQRSTLLGV